MTSRTLFRAFSALCALVLLAGCAEIETRPTTTAPTPPPLPYAWNGDGVPGPAKIVVHIHEQRAYFFKGKALVGETTVSTGKPGFSTPPGQYRVVWKNKDHISTRFGDYVDDFGNVVKSNIDSAKDPRPKGSHYDGARMPYAMFFRGGYAMHQGYVPPYAASHGCIRLPSGIAEIFFNNAPYGTPVIVKQESGMHSAMVPSLNPVPSPAPSLVLSTAPASVRPASVRPTVPVPTPVPVRSPAAVLSRAPAPVRSPSPTPAAVLAPALRARLPVPVRTPSPTPAANLAPAPRARVPVPIRPSPTPAAVLAPAPRTRVPAPVRAPSPTPAANLAPASRARPPIPIRAPSPTPAPNLAPVPRARVPSPTPTATPKPASRARARANAERSRPRQDRY